MAISLKIKLEMQHSQPQSPAMASPVTQAQETHKENHGQPKSYYFETQTKRLKHYYQQHQEELIGRKVLFNNSTGTIRYFGPLVHQGKPASSEGELWVGMEWEEVNRGKHNGTVNGHSYFHCKDKQGSLIKYQKIQFGYRLQIALFKRYFRVQELHHAKDIYDDIQQIKKDLKHEEKGQKEAKVEEAINKKIHKIQYDAQAYLDTVKQKKKILIEFVGFDEIWHKINNLDKIQSISLAECKICDLGPLGQMGTLLKSLKVLSLEDNLLSHWNQIYQLGYQLPQLNQLSVSSNTLPEPTFSFEEMSVVNVIGRNESFSIQNSSIFKGLRSLILINTGLTWRTFFKIVAAFRQVQAFILCKNDLSDTQNIDKNKLHYLKETTFLNLEEVSLTNFSELQVFSQLPKLDKLILNRNKLGRLGRNITGFDCLKHLSVQHCEFQKAVVLYEISLLKQLQSLNVKHNLMGDKLGNSYIRMRAVAEVPTLTMINGAQLKKVERKDFEIFYLRETFRQYFSFKKVPDYDYDYEDFLKYCEEHHPNIPRLIKKYGNPYEVQKKKQIQEAIKEEVKAVENKKGTGMVAVLIEYKETGSTDNKKIPLSWTVMNFKNFLAKTTKIPSNMLKITCHADPNSGPELMTENHKNLSFYSLMAGSRIVVEREV